MEESLRQVGVASARLFAGRPYMKVRLEEVAAEVTMPRPARGRRPRQAAAGQGRSLMWLYGLIQSKGQAVALAAAVAWAEHLALLPGALSPGRAVREAESLQESRSVVSVAIGRAAGFIADQRFLFEQLAAGLSDLPQRRNAVRRDWPDSPLGRVASGARDGQCAIFTDWLVPALAAAYAPVWPADELSVRPVASELSDLVFRGSLRGHPAAPEAVASGLAAYWFERHLLAPTGSPGVAAVRELDNAERAVGVLPPSSTADRVARAARARAVLATGRAHRRAVTEYEAVTAAFTSAREWDHACDAASRLSFALRLWGDLDRAAHWAWASRDLASEHLRPADQRIPRADTMAANVAVAAGQPAQARALAHATLTVRASVDDREKSRSSWRRLSLSQEAHALALAGSGQVDRAVTEAAALAADREQRLPSPGPAPVPVIEARRLLGYALLERGSLSRARDVLTQVLADRAARGEKCAAHAQRAAADLARCLLLLGRAGEASALLAEAPGTSDWFARRVSFRLACSMWRYQAEALLSQPAGRPVDHDGVTTLLARCEEHLGARGVDRLDPLRLAICRSKARARHVAGDEDGAIAMLTGAVARQLTAGEPHHPRLLAAQCELGGYLAGRGRSADLAAAERQFSQVTAVSREKVAETHPCRLAGHLGLAHLAALRGSPPNGAPPAFSTVIAAYPQIDPRHPVIRAAGRLAAAGQPRTEGARHGESGGDRDNWDE